MVEFISNNQKITGRIKKLKLLARIKERRIKELMDDSKDHAIKESVT